MSWNSSLCMEVTTSSNRQSTTLNSTPALKTKFLVAAEVFVLIPFITTHLQESPRWYHSPCRYQKRICRDEASNILLFLWLSGFSEHHPIYLCFYHKIFRALPLLLATCTLPSGCTEKYKLWVHCRYVFWQRENTMNTVHSFPHFRNPSDYLQNKLCQMPIPKHSLHHIIYWSVAFLMHHFLNQKNYKLFLHVL